MTETDVVERRMAETLPDMPRYRALSRVFSSRLMLAALIVAMVNAVFSVVTTVVEYLAALPEYRKSLYEISGLSGNVGLTEYDGFFNTIFYVIIGFALLLSIGVWLLQFLPQAMLVSRARRGKLLGRKPFTVLRTYCIVVLVLMCLNLFFSAILYASAQVNLLSVVTLGMTVVAYGAIVRLLGVQREIAMWGKASRAASYKATAFVLSLQIIPVAASMVLQVLQFVNPQYYRLEAYSSFSTGGFVASIFSAFVLFAATALYSLTILRAGKEIAAAEEQTAEL